MGKSLLCSSAQSKDWLGELSVEERDWPYLNPTEHLWDEL